MVVMGSSSTFVDLRMEFGCNHSSGREGEWSEGLFQGCALTSFLMVMLGKVAGNDRWCQDATLLPTSQDTDCPIL